VWLKVVECVPNPYNIQIRVEYNHHVTEDIDVTGALHTGQYLLDSRKHGYVAVRQTESLMMKSVDLPLTDSPKLLVDATRISLTNGQSNDIKFAQHLPPRVALGVLHDSEERAISGWTGHETERRAWVVPNDMTGEVSG